MVLENGKGKLTLVSSKKTDRFHIKDPQYFYLEIELCSNNLYLFVLTPVIKPVYGIQLIILIKSGDKKDTATQVIKCSVRL